MSQLTSGTRQRIEDIGRRHGFGPEAASTMFEALAHTGGGMAQFSHAEFGGSGQWMRGGMTMISDMFNNDLKARVDDLCFDLAHLLSEPQILGESRQGNRSPAQTSLAFDWWPSSLGSPTSTGGQNDVRYAYFAGAHRLAVDLRGRVTLYDTLNHEIFGFGQQQGANSSLSFSSEHGAVDLASLPIVPLS